MLPSGEPRRLPAIRSRALLVFAGIAVLLAVTLGAQWYLFRGAQAERNLEMLRKVAELEVAGAGRRFEDLFALLRSVVADRGLIPTAVPFSEQASVSRIQGNLARLIPGTLGVRLLPPGHAAVDQSASPPLHFAGLDLLRKAEQSSEPVPLEVHLVGTPQQHLATAVALHADNGEVRGVLHVALRNWLEEGRALPWGSLALQQRVGSQWVDVGPASAPQHEPGGAVEIPGASLRIAYWGGPGEVIGGPLGGALLFLAFLAAVAALLREWARRLSRDVVHDQIAVIGLASELAHGASTPSVDLRLRDSRKALEWCLRHFGRTQASEGAWDNQPRPVPGAAGDIELSLPPPAGSPGTGRQGAPDGGRQPEADPVESLPASIFRAYDIRGLVPDTLSVPVALQLGRAIGSEAVERGKSTVMLGRDTRDSSEALAGAVAKGLCQAGVDVIDLGVVPTPLLNFATRYLGGDAGVMVTASHNPAEYNGFKIIMGGVPLAGDALQRLRGRLERGELLSGSGGLQEQSLVGDYVQEMAKDIRLVRGLRVAVDCGGGTTRGVAPDLLRSIGCTVTEVDCGAHRSHGRIADTTRPEHMRRVRDQVLADGADLGLAFDEDGDRLGVVDSAGKIIWPDRVMMVLAADMLSRQPGSEILFDVKCSRSLSDVVLAHGGRPVMVRSGHSELKAELRATGSPLGGEWSGHIVFQDRGYGFDDGLYAAARLIEILARDTRPSETVFAAFPEPVSTPELLLPMEEGEPEAIVARVLEEARTLDRATVIALDGLRLDFPAGWGLVRSSNTRPALTFRFEGDTEDDLREVQQVFRDLFQRRAPEINLPF